MFDAHGYNDPANIGQAFFRCDQCRGESDNVRRWWPLEVKMLENAIFSQMVEARKYGLFFCDGCIDADFAGSAKAKWDGIRNDVRIEYEL